MSLFKFLSSVTDINSTKESYLIPINDLLLTKFDKNRFTLERLLKMMDDLYQQYYTSYLKWYIELNELGEKKSVQQDMDTESRLKTFLKIGEDNIEYRYNIKSQFILAWISGNLSESNVQEKLKLFEELHQQVYIKKKLKQIGYVVPANLTTDLYLQILKETLFNIRQSIQKYMQIHYLNKLNQQKVENMEYDYEEFLKQEMDRQNVIVPLGQKPEQFMHHAYIKFVHDLAINEQGQKRFQWSSLVQSEQIIHQQMIEKITNTEKEKHPLESADTDIVVDYNIIPGFLKREYQEIDDPLMQVIQNFKQQLAIDSQEETKADEKPPTHP